MASWRDNFGAAELRHFGKTFRREDLEDLMPCMKCGVPTPVLLLDSKPPYGTPAHLVDSADFTVHECRECYGRGWEMS